MKFLRTYIEISNICNLQCTFCPEVERDKKILNPEQFRIILKKILPYTEQVCLHLMGEPLAHPQFLEILKICEEEKAIIHLTTNGTLLSKFNFDVFFESKTIRQINFSIHSYKDNFPNHDIKPYLYDILLFSKLALKLKPELYINYRLWNLQKNNQMVSENQDIIDHVCEFFQVPINERIDVSSKKSKNITGRLYFHFDSRFQWPNLNNPEYGEHGFCHALSQQLGIHADGTVVPCCLDKEAKIPLGNVLHQNFEDILESERLMKIKNGFKNHLLTEELCKKCSFIQRFDKKISKKTRSA
jgi:radical SAM protein with 4Fe4S-binding SPASM domain